MSLDYLILDAIPTENAIINGICSEIEKHNKNQVEKFLKILADNIDNL